MSHLAFESSARILRLYQKHTILVYKNRKKKTENLIKHQTKKKIPVNNVIYSKTHQEH